MDVQSFTADSFLNGSLGTYLGLIAKNGDRIIANVVFFPLESDETFELGWIDFEAEEAARDWIDEAFDGSFDESSFSRVVVV